VIPVVFNNHPSLQIIFLIEWSLSHIILLIYMKANDCPTEFAIDIFNEVMLLLMYYELFWFLDGGLINGTEN
jgi:hypothetical protein